jgi:hypothetical protein
MPLHYQDYGPQQQAAKGGINSVHCKPFHSTFFSTNNHTLLLDCLHETMTMMMHRINHIEAI